MIVIEHRLYDLELCSVPEEPLISLKMSETTKFFDKFHEFSKRRRIPVTWKTFRANQGRNFTATLQK